MANNTYIRISKGPYAANLYLHESDNIIAQLTFDWSYDSIYYKFKDDQWETLTYLMAKEHKYDYYDDKSNSFRILIDEMIKELKGHSTISDKAINQVE